VKNYQRSRLILTNIDKPYFYLDKNNNFYNLKVLNILFYI